MVFEVQPAAFGQFCWSRVHHYDDFLEQKVIDAVNVECVFLTSALKYSVLPDRPSDDDKSLRVISALLLTLHVVF